MCAGMSASSKERWPRATVGSLDSEANEARSTDATSAPNDGGYRSVRAGPLPERNVCTDADAEADVVARVIRESSSTVATASSQPTLVLARTRAALDALQERLRARGITSTVLGDTTDITPTGVPALLATLHRAKGLEAPTVVLTAMQQVPQPFRGASDDDEDRRLHVT